MNTRRLITTAVMLVIMLSACLMVSGCFIVGGDHFLWF